ncbi:MAG TPA: ADOP family duplicated permease [Longimicrobiales bacterium]|nr:ADOP family duplicated permease [Longimicrobiales bacterium]
MTDSRWRRLFRIAPFRRDPRTDVDDELDFHLRRTVEVLVGKGWSEADARREATRRFGEFERYRRELERIDKGRMRMEGWTMWFADRVTDVRISVRGMARQPGFTAAVVVTFALGIGANAALFGIVDRLLLQPPAHVSDADAVVKLQVRRSFLGRTVVADALAFDDLQDFRRVPGFLRVAGYSSFSLTLGEGEAARRIEATFATHDLFPLLGVRAHLGRFYGPDDDRFDAPLVAVIGYGLWKSTFGGRPDVLGTTVRVAGVPYTVVGVAPRGFTGAGLARVDAWLPLRPAKVATDGGDQWFSNRGYSWVRAVAREAPGAGRAAALDQATSLHRAGHAEQSEWGRYDPDAVVVATPLVGDDTRPEGSVALWLAGVSALVLLIACANVANLLLARSLRQRRESAVRLALGISPWRLVEQRVLDTLLLAGVGGLVGLAVAHWGGGALRAGLLPDIDWSGAPDGRVLGFTLAVSVLAGLVAAAAPALLAARQRLSGVLAQGARGSGTGTRIRGLLTLGQAALATVLLVGAGLFIRSMDAARSADLGFDVDHILAVDLEPSTHLEGAELKAYYLRAVERLARVPGVRAAAATNSPFGWSFTTTLRAQGLDSIPRSPAGGPYYHRVTAGYFEATGLQVTRGRPLDAADVRGPPVAVLNETMARLLWPGEDPLGRCLREGDEPDAPCTRVVGVTAYAHRGGLQETESPQYYTPMTDAEATDPRGLVVRVEGDPTPMEGPVVRALLAELPHVRLVRARTMRDLLDPEFRGWRLGTTVFTLFGVLALLVAGVGLYSLMSFDVAHRRREIGIRMALGSSSERIHAQVLSRALGLATLGVGSGLAVAYLVAPRTTDVLYEVSPHDPFIFAAAAAVLLVAAGAAGVLPARRATRVEPTEALRLE